MKPVLFSVAIIIMLCAIQSVYGFNRPKQEINKRIVTAFYHQALNEKDFKKASTYLGAQYIQHNPHASDGREGLEAFIKYLREEYPNSKSNIKRVFADGDYVILHVHSVRIPGERGRAIVDIFRIENQKIVEHWDVIQEIPEQLANSNGMF